MSDRFSRYLTLLLIVLAGAALHQVGRLIGFPPLITAIALGMVVGALAGETGWRKPVESGGKLVLRAGVVLLGGSIAVTEFARLGWPVIAALALLVPLIVTLGWAIGRRAGLGNEGGLLCGVGVGICGASATAAAAGILGDDRNIAKHAAFTILAVTLIGTACLIVYPLAVQMLGVADAPAGVFIGGSIHDVAQAIGAGFLVSEDAGRSATAVKMLRVAMLPLVLLGLMALVAGRRRAEGAKIALPIFPLLFFAAVAANSLGLIPEPLPGWLNTAAKMLFAGALMTFGLQLHWREVRSGAARYFLVAGTLSVVIAGAMAAIAAWL
jgi:uncharacterized integral membrane protein (TIGR00698 family)